MPSRVAGNRTIICAYDAGRRATAPRHVLAVCTLGHCALIVERDGCKYRTLRVPKIQSYARTSTSLFDLIGKEN
jgi:hypothetical protein